MFKRRYHIMEVLKKEVVISDHFKEDSDNKTEVPFLSICFF